MARNSELQMIRGLLAGAENGKWTLPEPIMVLWRRLPALDKALTGLYARRLPKARGEYVAAVLAAIDAGEPLPDLQAVSEAHAADEAAHLAYGALYDERDWTQDSIVSEVTSFGDVIVTEHLRPALADLMTVAERAVDACGGAVLSVEEALRAPAKARESYLALDALAERYLSLRSAQRMVRLVMPSTSIDVDEAFREVRNRPDLREHFMKPVRPGDGGRRRFGPADPKERIVWLVTSGAEPWMPTPEEQDQRFLEYFPDSRVARMHRERMAVG